MSYIIRNCPCFEDEGTFYNCVNERIEGDCQDCTDCVMKQIVEKCEQYKKDYITTNGVWLLANNIINSLDIQEVE